MPSRTTLTLRGRILLASGIAAGVAGWFVGQPAVIAIGVLLLCLPVLGIATVRRSRFALGSARTVEPSRLALGSTGEVVLTIENASRLPTGVLLLEDDVSETLGDPGRVLLDRVAPRAQRAERYPVIGLERGRARVGPLTVTVADPFGTAASTRAFTATNPVLVTPRIVPLGPPGSSRAPGGRGDARVRSLSVRGDEDVLPREHRSGDDIRRIHWRATARTGELMVRREEQSWRSSLVIVLDTRASAHIGSGPSSSFEWAVSAAASIGLAYLRLGWRITVIGLHGRTIAEATPGWTDAIEEALLEPLSDVRADLEPVSPAVGLDVEGSSAVIAVVGHLTDDVERALARPRAGFAGCLALEPTPAAQLRALGWHVALWSRATPIELAWASLGAADPAVRPDTVPSGVRA